jgi:DNA repair photolyase
VKIISASRRTDIAAFYSDWFLRRLEAGYCEWRNPFGGQRYRVSLLPEDCLALVFWTRHPAPIQPHLRGLRERGYHFYFHITINGYSRELESHSPPVERAIDAFRRLSDEISPALTHWRFDPIIQGSETGPEYHLRRFEELSRALEGYTRRCYFSFVDYYGKTKRNLARLTQLHGLSFDDPPLERKVELASELAALGKRRGITLYSCCNDGLVGNGVEKSHCVDGDLIRAMRPDAAAALKASPTRQDCGCVASADIGAYDTCPFGCAYCYATNSRAAALERMKQHCEESASLWEPR